MTIFAGIVYFNNWIFLKLLLLLICIFPVFCKDSDRDHISLHNGCYGPSWYGKYGVSVKTLYDRREGVLGKLTLPLQTFQGGCVNETDDLNQIFGKLSKNRKNIKFKENVDNIRDYDKLQEIAHYD